MLINQYLERYLPCALPLPVSNEPLADILAPPPLPVSTLAATDALAPFEPSDCWFGLPVNPLPTAPSDCDRATYPWHRSDNATMYRVALDLKQLFIWINFIIEQLRSKFTDFVHFDNLDSVANALSVQYKTH